ncbi:putative Usp family protein [Gordonia araii NBRC 100433]|uniref:Putative Usp family protein n=1 Tax=Gordonia araii NBRC 100433 TaxID=1073574 RepID=G7H624_9ACTN|nr:universal stress protein [Gordonia araii]NNG98738.1 universal stress protein [Gordonia araii NBRC 100433]GAB11263.1 putative Usp family protein [Gordonia araii NBRC 100433]
MSTVVVGVDNTDTSLHATRWAASLAAREESELHIVGAYDASTSNYAPGLVIPQDVVEAIANEAKEAVQKAAATALEAEPDVRVRTSVGEGDAARTLLEVGKDATAIVIGTRRLGSVKGLLLGSVGVTIAAHYHGRVVVIGDEGGTGPVVVGVGDTPISDPAVKEAYRQADSLRVPLLAVHTWAQLDADALHGFGIEPDAIERMSSEATEAVAERLAGYSQDYPDVEVRRVVVPDDPGKAIIDAATDANASLIVVGSRGRGGFKGLLLGSTSQKVLQHAGCPVMIVRE